MLQLSPVCVTDVYQSVSQMYIALSFSSGTNSALTVPLAAVS